MHFVHTYSNSINVLFCCFEILFVSPVDFVIIIHFVIFVRFKAAFEFISICYLFCHNASHLLYKQRLLEIIVYIYFVYKL